VPLGVGNTVVAPALPPTPPPGGVFAPNVWDGRFSAGQQIVYGSNGIAIQGQFPQYGFIEGPTNHHSQILVPAPDGGSGIWVQRTINNGDENFRMPGVSVNHAASMNSIGLFSATQHNDVWIRFQFYVASPFPLIDDYLGGASAFFQIYETYGSPYGGASPCSFNIGDQQHLGYNVVYVSDHSGANKWEVPLTYNVRHTITFHQQFFTGGHVEVFYDGVQRAFRDGLMSEPMPALVAGVNDGGLNTMNFTEYVKNNCVTTPASSGWTTYEGGMMCGTTFASVGSGA
jgi:hypothetical protein